MRSHFNNFLDEVEMEEQRSENPKIHKLLKTASKQGDGSGRPEFIISYKTNPDFVIVVECKADTTKHESKMRDKYADYAVDGALLYASFLAKEFDVLAIGVSGETKQSARISHFLHLKGANKAVPVFGEKLLAPSNYLNDYLKHPEKIRQDYDALVSYTQKLNKRLHSNKILGSQRSLLISAVLIALGNEAFRDSYKAQRSPAHLAGLLVQTVVNELEDAGITGDKLESLGIQFSFIKTDTSLATKEKILRELIDEIDENINSFIRTHEYYDVLGEMYVAFLRYANSDKGLGIVLTPPHITELFAGLARVSKKSIVYDNCAGTGGFLIAAMKQMVADAKGDLQKIQEIKQKQIIGTEYQANIFALAVSNMCLHEDGKTSIISGSCFDENVLKSVKAKKPNVGMLNPPYKSDTNDTENLEFVLNSLECLVDGGTCVAIVPMQDALAQDGNIGELKKRLLKNHTLEAVLSMPDELFFNSKVGVVSCIMVFTAHRPHPLRKETYLGYYKDDGFVKRKGKGRIDALNQWKQVQDKWLSGFMNRTNEPGFSVNIALTAEMEWAAEAYMETDYSGLGGGEFEEAVRNYAGFLHANIYCTPIKWTANLAATMNKTVKVSDLFVITYGNSLELINMSQCKSDALSAVPFISRTEKNNGISAFVKEERNVKKNPAHTLTVAVGGSVLSTFYQPLPFYTGFHVLVLSPKREMDVLEMLFYARCIQENKYKYNYGRQANRTLKDVLIPARMPATLSGRLASYYEDWRRKFPKTELLTKK